MNKKGGVFNRETMFIAMGVLVGAVAIFGLLDAASEILDTNALFKKYIASDLALIIGAVYAAPGEVAYEYPMDPGRTYYVRVSKNLVEVSSASNFKKGETFSYRIANDESVGFEFIEYGQNLPKESELVDRPINVTIQKAGSPPVVTVGFKR